MNLDNKNYYFNRELSWLEFNFRVFEEALDKTNPVLERLRFLAISASNLDEFFMVRVSGLMDQVAADFKGIDPSGMTASEQLKAISKKVHKMVSKQYSCLNRSILPSLEIEQISFLRFNELNEKQIEFIESYFETTIYPILTPMAIDQSRPFPLLNNKTLNIITELSGDAKDEKNFAVVQVPTVVSRIIPLPTTELLDSPKEQGKKFIFLEDVIKQYIGKLFIGNKVLNAYCFRITRDSGLEFVEEEAEDLLLELEKSIKRRRWGDPVRIEVEKSMDKSSRIFLENCLELDDNDIYEISGALDLTVWNGFINMLDSRQFSHLLNKPLPPQPCIEFKDKDIFQVIRNKDVLVHHPYQSFDCVLDFVKTAAHDPQVLAIKQTLYRVSGNSPIVNSLIAAAENGKQVTVLVELKARFDEENNINWAKKLEKSGCHVVYGLVGLKIHCKICLVVRKEDDGIRRYIHLGTGNYNDSTAKIYTDIGFFTCKETFGKDISALFNVLTGYSINTDWNKIAVAPTTLRQTFIKHIDNETKNAKAGKNALIIAKMNSLVDISIIQALYRASIAGVKIKLIIRGICCLKTGIKGVSDNITVVNVVDRFLEHSRIFYFENSGNNRIFLSSADWMPRNLDRRVEVLFPIEDEKLKERVLEVLEIIQTDTVKLRIKHEDGSYEKIDKRGKEHLQAQLTFHELAVRAVQQTQKEENSSLFVPIYHEIKEE